MKKLFITLAGAVCLLCSYKGICVPKLSSFPSATATIFLDFDGHYVQSSLWNSGLPIACAPADMTEQQITESFNRVAEDFRPFNVNITTDSTVFLAAPLNRRIRMIITPTNYWCQGAGGVAYLGSFTFGDDTPGFIFSNMLGPNSPKIVAECISHETGHAVGLSHQSKYGNDCDTPLEAYNSGSATGGEIGWAPIMGNSYYRNMSNWNNGPTPYGCTAVQDNLTTITTTNGFGYRVDDYTETMNAATTAMPITGINIQGLISTNSDKDAFKLVFSQRRNLQLSAIPFNVGGNYIGANLDMLIQLYNSTGTLLRTYDPATMSISIDTVLNAGTYYFVVSGTGNINTGSYGSLGSYNITGTSTSALPIRSITLSGNADKSKHNLNWQIIADEPIKTVMLESSADGINFSSLTTVNVNAAKFSYQSYSASTVYYRLKALSVINETAYSNTIALKGTGNVEKSFHLNTYVQSDIQVQAAQNYQYIVMDANGRAILKGSGMQGFNRINIADKAAGIYFVQLFSTDQQQTERILKQ